ncbi:hypothetical protein A0U40_15785 [[Bacillus] sp. KCTC 13219]|nr:hypothetical protein A0U40_15785 [[Bacillus] sp. KCTC 13219]
MVMRIGGLASGMDIDSLVEKLMQAERAPLNKLLQNKTLYEWQRDAYRDINKKLKTFDTYIADNLILKSINTKTAASSNSSLVSAVATGKATGTLSIEGVSQLAEASRITTGQLNATGATKMADLATGTLEFRAVQADGSMAAETTKITITDDMTVNDFVKKVNESGAGVSAVFENGRFSFTAKNTGKGDIELSGDTAGLKLDESEGAVIRKGQNAVFQINGIATERSTNTFAINGYNVTLNSVFNAASATSERYNGAYAEWKNTTTVQYNQAIADKLLAKNTATSDYNEAKIDYDVAKESFFGTTTIENGDKTAFNTIKNPALARNLTVSDLSAIQNSVITNETELQNWLNSAGDEEVKNKLKDANINFNQFNAIKSLDYDKLQSLSAQAMYDVLGKNFLSDLSSDDINAIKSLPKTEADFNSQIEEWQANGTVDEKALAEKLSKLSTNQKEMLRQVSDDDLGSMTDLATKQLNHSAKLADKTATENAYQALVDRQLKADADFKIAYKNQFGTDYTSGDPGKVTVPATTESVVTLSSTTNVDDMMNKIKEFVATYNGLIKDFKDQTTQSKYRDYKPLTDEQKKEMSESEIKLWEEKAKSGLLRNDAMIRDGLANMRALVYETNPGLADSKFSSLFSIGITTSKNYNEGGTLEIDEEKLRKALEADPDAVERLFKNVDGKKDDVIDGKKVDTRGYLEKLRDTMKTFEVSIEKKAGRATMTEQQYSLGKSIIDTDKRISTWQDKLKNIEARYWKQFTAMEQAINRANQQSSMLFSSSGQQ